MFAKNNVLILSVPTLVVLNTHHKLLFQFRAAQFRSTSSTGTFKSKCAVFKHYDSFTLTNAIKRVFKSIRFCQLNFLRSHPEVLLNSLFAGIIR